MSRMMGLLAVLIGLFQLNAGEPTLGGEQTSILVPEPGYIPKVGDRAVLYSVESGKIPSDLWCATTSEACRAFIINLFAEDEAEGGETNQAQALADGEKIVELAPNTEVQLLTCESVTVPAAKEGMPLKCTYFSIQVLSGPLQGKTLYTLDLHIARLVKQTTGEAPAATAVAEATPAASPSAPPTPGLTLTLESPEAPEASETKPSAPVADAPASASITLESTDVPPSAGGGGQPTPEPLTPAPSSPAPLTLEPDAPAAPAMPPEALSSTTTAPPDAVLPAPGVLVSTPEASAEDEPPVPDSAPNAASTQVEAPALDPAPPAIPAPILVSEPTSESESTGSRAPESTDPIPQPALAASPLEEQAPASPLEPPSLESKPELPQTVTPKPTLESDAIRRDPAVAPPAPAPALVETKPEPESAEIHREDTVATHSGSGRADVDADSNPAPDSEARASEPRILPSQAERSPATQPRGLITTPAPALPHSAPELLTVASGQERAGKNLEALVAYRILERNHPATPEAKVASLRIKRLNEAMELRSQEARASQLMKFAEQVEASGKHSLAFEYFQQIVKVYPTTPTARRARARLDTTALKNPALRR